MSDDFKIISTGAWTGLTEVRVYEETIEHVKSEHPEVPIELPSVSTAVEQAIINPTHIEKSYGNSVVIVDTGTTDAGGQPLRIPIKIVEGTSGRLKTVYFAEGSGQAEVLWRRDNNA